MTCREKLKIEYPDRINDVWIGGCQCCPNYYGYLDNPEYCDGDKTICSSDTKCRTCWDGEIPEIKSVYDSVSHPSHYTYGKIECIDFIFDKDLNFALGNAIKYIVRAGHKSSAGMSDEEKTIHDLEKAKQYIDFEIEHIKGER